MQNKLTARERIETLLDKGTFVDLLQFVVLRGQGLHVVGKGVTVRVF